MSQRSYLSCNLKWLLKKHNLTMAELARRCNIAGPVLYRLVTGLIENPQISTLLPLSNYFNCSLDMLVTHDIEKNPERLNIKTEINEIRHQMRGAIAIINTALLGTNKMLPTLLDCYHVLPKDLRPQQLSEESLRLLPQIVNNALQTIANLTQDINLLKEKTDEIG